MNPTLLSRILVVVSFLNPLTLAAGTTRDPKLVKDFKINQASVKIYQKSPTHKSSRKLRKREEEKLPELTPRTKRDTHSSNRHHEEVCKETDEDCNLGASGMVTLDLTAADPGESICFPGFFQKPSIEDCSLVIDSQLRSAEGLLTAAPGTLVSVSSGNCALTFQNPSRANFNLKFDFAQLGKIGGHLQKDCLTGSTESIGAATRIQDYLEYDFKDVVISLQRYDEHQE